jgi:Rieske Fe-S protein
MAVTIRKGGRTTYMTTYKTKKEADKLASKYRKSGKYSARVTKKGSEYNLFLTPTTKEMIARRNRDIKAIEKSYKSRR